MFPFYFEGFLALTRGACSVWGFDRGIPVDPCNFVRWSMRRNATRLVRLTWPTQLTRLTDHSCVILCSETCHVPGSNHAMLNGVRIRDGRNPFPPPSPKAKTSKSKSDGSTGPTVLDDLTQEPLPLSQWFAPGCARAPPARRRLRRSIFQDGLLPPRPPGQ